MTSLSALIRSMTFLRVLPISIASALLSATALSALPSSAYAASAVGTDSDSPVDMAAEEVTHDRALNIVTARGEVEINQADYTLYADTVSYNINQDSVTASGNVSLITPAGEVIFADHMQLTGKMKQGAMQNLLMVTANRSRTAAANAQRSVTGDGHQINTLDHAVYSPCDTCRGQKNPLWQIKAVKIIHDEEDRDITYYNATLDFFGIPVAYTPYISHADPTVKRRSGFLFPTFGNSNTLGLFYRQPYYWVTSPQSDVTLAPMFTSDSASIVMAEYRQTLADGSFVIDGSGRAGGTSNVSRSSETRSRYSEKRDNDRGHVNVVGEWDVDDVWKASTELHAVSSDTYLKRYKLPGKDDYQTNRIALEGFVGDDYARLETLSFRELRDLSSPQKNPIALPRADWQHNSERGIKGGYWTSTLSSVGLTRNDGADSYRMSGSAHWTLPYVAPSGEHYTLKAGVRSDVYQVKDYTMADGTTFDGTTGRIIPEMEMRWSYPLAKPGARTTQILEPVIIGTVSPNGGNPSEIPNEDSRDFSFDDTQTLASDRFTGHDRIETGPRAAYGLNYAVYMNGTANKLSTFFGQAYHTHKDAAISEYAGIRDGFSDYVGRVRYEYGSYFSTAYRFRLNQSSFDVARNDISVSGGTDPLRLSLSYINARKTDLSDTTTGDLEQISLGITSRFLRDWSFGASTSHDLNASNSTVTTNSGPLSFSSYLTYEDECFLLRLTGTKDYTSDRDAESGWTIMATLVFKSIGDTQFSF